MDALESEIGSVMWRMRRAMSERARAVHPELSATAYWILTTVGRGQDVRASTIAEEFALDKGAVSRQLSELERLGLLHRRKDPKDGRANILVLTDLGRSRLESVNDTRRHAWTDRMSSWSVADLEGLTRQLARYNSTLESR